MSRQEHTKSEYDAIVVGGGLVGASTALALAQGGLRVALLDAQDLRSQAAHTPAAGKFDPRVSAITPASRRFLESLGVWAGVQQRRASAYTDMHVWEADGTASIHFSAYDIHAPELGHIVENGVLLSALYAVLAQTPAVDVLAPVSLQSLQTFPGPRSTDACRVTLTLEDGRELHSGVLIASDGARSKVRELAGFKTREWDYEHHAIVTTVRTALPHQATAIQRFMDAGVLAFLPLDDGEPEHAGHFSSIVWSVLPEQAERLLGLDDAAFARELEQAIEGRLGPVEELDKRFSFPLRQRHATDYVQAGIALVGDAAHTIHPLAGQGVNLGFLDADALARVILQARQRHLPLGCPHVLRRYQRQRIGHNLGMMWVMEGFRQLYADRPLPLRLLRNAGMSALDSLPLLKNRLMRAAMGVEVL